jgi:two-component system, NtrC family, response regulator HydG
VTTGRLKILVVDDNRSGADALARLLRKTGDEVEAVYDGKTAIGRLQADPPDIVLTDLKMEPVDGMAVLEAARAMRPPVETIVFTAYGAIDVAVRAMHMGARDFLTKPVTVEQVNSRLDQLRAELADEPTQSEELDIRPAGADGFVARSEASRQLLAKLQRAADVPSPVWIEGELGSGRSYVARTLHRIGDQRRGADTPFTVRPARSDDPWPESGTVLVPDVDDLSLDAQAALHQQLRQAPGHLRIMATAVSDGRQHQSEGKIRPERY